MTKALSYCAADPKVLEVRSDLLHELRTFFRSHGFVEVETPLLSQDTVVDLYLDPMTVEFEGQTQRFLQTSPEFGMKRLLASGMKQIYQITRAFRMEESGQRHNPEFTMLEWYRCGDHYAQGRELLAKLIDALTATTLCSISTGACQQQSFATAFNKFVQLDPFFATTQQLTEIAEKHGLALPENDEAAENILLRRELINFLWAELVDPHLGIDHPVIIYDWPGSEAALAQTRLCIEGPHSYEVAERFELYLNGIELANGYHELLDHRVLENRNDLTNRQRQQLGKTRLPSESRLLEVMRDGLPASCGVALGVDRLLMSLLGVDDIKQVMAFPWDRA